MIFKKSLDAEIAEIFAAGDTVASAKVTEILEKAADELDGLERAAKAARLKALDPVLGPDEARTAHMAMGEAQFAVDRRSAAIVKLRELGLSYTFRDQDWLERSGLSSLALSVYGRNLITWSDYSGVDPETNLWGQSLGRGIDYFNNPQTRSLVINLTATR